MRIAWFDCAAGVAGDMWVASLLDLGLPLRDLEAAVASLRLPGVSVAARSVRRAGLAATHFQVTVPSGEPPRAAVPFRVRRVRPPAGEQRHGHPVVPPGRQPVHRRLVDLLEILARSAVPAAVRERCEAVFRRLAEAEAKVHACSVDEVHFHEVGGEDTVVDVVCAVLGLHHLGVERVFASAVTVGSGTVRCAHGTLPVPAPATLELLAGVPIRTGGLEGERTTPTGAALLKVLVHEFEPRCTWVPERTGHGAGTRDDADVPNVLRCTLGDLRDPGAETDVQEIVCQLDTATGELLAFLVAGALERGALDAFVTPVVMKKGRPGHLVTALCAMAARDAVTRFLLEESTSLGVRVHTARRVVLERWQETVASEFGAVRCKVARLPSGRLVRRPEEDEVLRLVRERGLTRAEVLARLRL
ncbi:MAG: nickel pincer cofactor biosynthesis protein LarC [Planctomycetes bacterium]|nr:nickel pincer cofactor biosynthesis protein LarC [Planctomycetota bacterium]